MKKSLSRREFIYKTSLLLSGTSLCSLARWDLTQKLANKLFPIAHAQGVSPRRVVEIGIRAGVPLMRLGTGREFSQLSQARFPNSPTDPSGYQQAANTTLYLSPDNLSLMPHAANIAITQGVAVQGGHTASFPSRDANMGLTAPIVELSNRNPTLSAVHAIEWQSGGNTVTNVTNGMKDTITVTESTLMDLFKRPYFPVTTNDLNAIMEASANLSHQQSLIIERAMKNARNMASAQSKGTSLITQDYTQLLQIDGGQVPAVLAATGGAAGLYGPVGRALAYSYRAMAANLVNSVQVNFDTGDWHGSQDLANGQGANFASQFSQRLAAFIGLLKTTPDQASATGEMLWDTTVIYITSEFTRGVDAINRDNSDGGTQGAVIIGKYVRGGYYGAFDLSGTGDGTAYGFDPQTGNPVMAAAGRNSNAQLYHTVQRLLGNNYDSNMVLNCMITG